VRGALVPSVDSELLVRAIDELLVVFRVREQVLAERVELALASP